MMGIGNRGFALPAVIFLMVVVSLLIANMSRILSTESAATNLYLLGTKAYWAAQSANDWVAYQIHVNNACPTTPANFSIEGFSISVSCIATAYTEASVSGVIYQVSSQAVMGSSPAELDYVSRTVDMVLDVQ